MLLTELIREDLIKINLEAKDKWEAIEELIDVLISAHELSLSDRTEVVKAVLEREKSLSTGLEHGVAIPHGAVDCLDDLVGVLGTTPGIPFQSHDDQDARLIILLLIPKGAFQHHVRTLAGIAKLGSIPTVREKICHANTATEVMEALKESDLTEGMPPME
ncbi:MAG: PTS sugar transporter subunit IIA [Phycisphaeraceae bacterium]|nr:PTS sugar transporter subunit IIA [Phycisphaeraceae bacterium]